MTSKYFGLWCFFNVFSTLYSCCWDFYMDWGLFRSKEPSTYGLRPKIKYHQKFYYYAMVCNVALRFFWVYLLFTPADSVS